MNNIIYPSKKIYICGSVGSNWNNLEKLILEENNNIFIINGGICRNGNDDEISERIAKIKEIMLNFSVYYNLGPEDLIYLNSLNKRMIFNDVYDWLLAREIFTKIDFSNQTRVLAFSGGIKDINQLKDLEKNIDSCFVALINEEPWHKYYNGKFGLIVSDCPRSDCLEPQLYPYSCGIGYKNNNGIILQEVNSQGLGNFFTI